MICVKNLVNFVGESVSPKREGGFIKKFRIKDVYERYLPRTNLANSYSQRMKAIEASTLGVLSLFVPALIVFIQNKGGANVI